MEPVAPAKKSPLGASSPRSRRLASPPIGWSQHLEWVSSLATRSKALLSGVQQTQPTFRSRLRLTSSPFPPARGTTYAFSLFRCFPSRGKPYAILVPSGDGTGFDSKSEAPVRPRNAPDATSTIWIVAPESPVSGDSLFMNTIDVPSRVHDNCGGGPPGANCTGIEFGPEVTLCPSPPCEGSGQLCTGWGRDRSRKSLFPTSKASSNFA